MSESDDQFITNTVHAELRATRGQPRARDEVRVYASGIGDLLEVRDGTKPSGCQRKAYYPFFPDRVTEAPMAAKVLLNFAVGDAYHATIEKLLADSGVLVASEVPLKAFDPSISGRLDWLVRHPKYGLAIADGKSMSPWAFKSKRKPQPADVAQVSSYFKPAAAWCRANGIEVLDTDFRYGVLLYYDKATGDLEEAWFERDESIVTEIETVSAAFVAKVVADRASDSFDPPPIPVGAEKGNGWPCKWGRDGATCRFYEECFPELAKAEATKVGFSLGA